MPVVSVLLRSCRRPWFFCLRVGLALGVLASGLSVAAGTAHAQASASSDSSPFRTGQYGVEFGLGDFASIGLQRFYEPQRALLLDVQGSFNRTTRELPSLSAGGGDGGEATNTDYQVAVRGGLRRYQSVTSSVQRFSTLGVFARAAETGLSSIIGATPGDLRPMLGRRTNSTAAGGVFAELGAAWMVTSNLSLGAVWSAEAFYSRSKSALPDFGIGPNSQTSSGWGLAFGRVGVRGNIYF